LFFYIIWVAIVKTKCDTIFWKLPTRTSSSGLKGLTAVKNILVWRVATCLSLSAMIIIYTLTIQQSSASHDSASVTEILQVKMLLKCRRPHSRYLINAFCITSWNYDSIIVCRYYHIIMCVYRVDFEIDQVPTEHLKYKIHSFCNVKRL